MSSQRELLNSAAARLAAAGVDSARLDARLLLAQALGIASNELVLGDREIPAEATEAFETFLARRIAREPLAYITGEKEFWSLSFAVGEGALVPRPESETLIEEAQKLFPDSNAPLRILDLGTGTGCLLLTLLTLYPRATGIGIDASAVALGWARRNAARLGLESRADLRLGDWDEGLAECFDLVLSNPPYVVRGDLAQLEAELHREPVSALDGGPDGLDAYRALASRLPRLMTPQGRVLLEIGADQGVTVPSLLRQAGLAVSHVAGDLAGRPRCVVTGPDTGS